MRYPLTRNASRGSALIVAAVAVVFATSAAAAVAPVTFSYSSTASNKITQVFPARGSCHVKYVGVDPLPDPRCTPGALNPAVTQATIATTICKVGYTTTIRPSTSVTGREKITSLASYSLPAKVTTEFDHFIPLEIGGASNSAKNLWPEPNDRVRATNVVNGKDAVENALHAAVCSRKVTLAAAQQAMATNWVTARSRLGV